MLQGNKSKTYRGTVGSLISDHRKRKKSASSIEMLLLILLLLLSRRRRTEYFSSFPISRSFHSINEIGSNWVFVDPSSSSSSSIHARQKQQQGDGHWRPV